MTRKQKKSKENILAPVSTSSSGIPKWRQSPINLTTSLALKNKFPPIVLDGYWHQEGVVKMTNIDRTGILAPHQSGRSPIDLDDKIVYPKKTPPLLLNGHWLNDGEATLSNNGRTASVYLCGNRIPSWISGGPLLQDVYDFHHVHFHWGKDNCFGCEHTINGTWFSMEAHAVHWNRKYFTFEAALQQKDGLCVLGYLFLATSTWPHPLLEKITDNLKHIVDPGKDVKIPPNCLSWMRSAIFCEGYYFYHGSLTQDPERTSTDCVLWVVFPTILRISTSQVEEFRKLKNIHGESIMANCTSVQPLRGRKIFWAIN